MKIIVEKDTSDKIYTDLGLLETSCDKEQFHIGMNVELEHGKVNEFTNVTNDDLLTTGKIAYAHLKEIPNYYEYLLDAESRYEENINKVVLITGGSEGLGKSIAKELSKACKVIITGIDHELLKHVSEELKCEYYKVDVTDFENSESMVADIIKKYNKIDVLINNAGILYEGGIDEMKKDEISKLIDINVKGVEYMTNIVSTYMIQAKSGQIVYTIPQSGQLLALRNVLVLIWQNIT